MFEHLTNCHGEWNLLLALIGSIPFVGPGSNLNFGAREKRMRVGDMVRYRGSDMVGIVLEVLKDRNPGGKPWFVGMFGDTIKGPMSSIGFEIV